MCVKWSSIQCHTLQSNSNATFFFYLKKLNKHKSNNDFSILLTSMQADECRWKQDEYFMHTCTHFSFMEGRDDSIRLAYFSSWWSQWTFLSHRRREVDHNPSLDIWWLGDESFIITSNLNCSKPNRRWNIYSISRESDWEWLTCCHLGMMRSILDLIPLAEWN